MLIAIEASGLDLSSLLMVEVGVALLLDPDFEPEGNDAFLVMSSA